MRNIQSHVSKELLTTGFFTESKYSGYQRIDDMATIVANPTEDDLYRGQFNVVYMKQLCDWHNRQRTPSDTCTKSHTGGGNPNSLKITKYFLITLHVNYRPANTNSVAARSKQVSIILWMHEKYITHKHQETVQEIFAKFLFNFKYVNEEEFLDIKQEYYRLQEEANDRTTWPQGGIFQIYKRLP
ncbi:24982_t:CDS:2, partial [Racocetra persica]